MASREEVTQAIFEICRDELPGINWQLNIIGAQRSSQVEGSISCTDMDFESISKGLVQANANYEIYIIDMQGKSDIDGMGDLLFEKLNDNNLGGLVFSCRVVRMAYGAAKEFSAWAVKLELQVAYNMYY